MRTRTQLGEFTLAEAEMAVKRRVQKRFAPPMVQHRFPRLGTDADPRW